MIRTNPDLYLPYFQEEPGVGACYTTAKGGILSTPYTNHSVLDILGVGGRRAILPMQKHTNHVVTADEALLSEADRNRPLRTEIDDDTPDSYWYTRDGVLGLRTPFTDGAVTDRKDLVLTTIHADCLALFFYDPVKKAIGLCHAGWRGSLAGIGTVTLRRMEEAYGTKAEDVRAAISAGIAQCCFQVGEEVVFAFRERYGFTDRYCTKDPVRLSETALLPENMRSPRYHMDLKGINREILLSAGILPQHIEIDPHCTCCEPERFSSYRREQKGCTFQAGILFLR